MWVLGCLFPVNTCSGDSEHQLQCTQALRGDLCFPARMADCFRVTSEETLISHCHLVGKIPSTTLAPAAPVSYHLEGFLGLTENPFPPSPLSSLSPIAPSLLVLLSPSSHMYYLFTHVQPVHTYPTSSHMSNQFTHVLPDEHGPLASVSGQDTALHASSSSPRLLLLYIVPMNFLILGITHASIHAESVFKAEPFLIM